MTSRWASRGVSWVNFSGYVLLASPTPLKSIFWLVIDPILVAFGQMLFLQSQLSHLLFVHLPYKAF